MWNKSIIPHVKHGQPHLVLMNSTQMVTGLETYVQFEKTLAARVIFPDGARCCPVCFKHVINVCVKRHYVMCWGPRLGSSRDPGRLSRAVSAVI